MSQVNSSVVFKNSPRESLRKKLAYHVVLFFSNLEPPPPSNLVKGDIGSRKVTLRWTKPASLTKPVKKYIVCVLIKTFSYNRDECLNYFPMFS